MSSGGSPTVESDPRSDRGAEAFAVSPFQRLARTHAFSVAGDALLAIALADSLFFAVDPNDARWRVGAYLLLTIAPFAIVAPFLGPMMDRLKGGHRFMIIGTALVRAGLMAALVLYVQDVLLFPLAFSMLVMGKTYAVAKSAVVPTTVDSEEALVRSNSRLSILSAVAGGTAGIPGVILLRFGGAPWVLGLGVIVFVVAAVLATRIPATTVAAGPTEAAERAELKSANILVASSAMGYLRGVVGFVTMLLAFDLRGGVDEGPTTAGVEIGHQIREALGLIRLDLTTGGAPPWHFGVALIGVGLGGLLGSAGVPRLRERLREERILAYALIVLTIMALLAAISTGLGGAFVMSFGIALVAQGGKQAFDALVQRDAPRANLGRTFSRYESRFQLVWVLGALIPVVVPLLARVGYFLVAGTAAFVAATYWFGRTPNPAAIVSDGILAEGLDRLAQTLPGPLGRRLSNRTWSRVVEAPDADPGSTTRRYETSPPDRTRTAGDRPEGDGPSGDRPKRRRSRGGGNEDSQWPDRTAEYGRSRSGDRRPGPDRAPVDRTAEWDGNRAVDRDGDRRPDRTVRMPDPDETTRWPGTAGPDREPRPDDTQVFPGVPDPPPPRRRPVRRPPDQPDSWPSREP
jgi:MFS family permease